MAFRLAAFLFWCALASVPAAAQAVEEDPLATIDRTVVIADFESAERAWRLRVRSPDDGAGDVGLSNLEAPPVAGSQRYLYVAFRGPGASGFYIEPPAPVALQGYVQRVEIWVYGGGRPDELYASVVDRRGRSFLLFLGALNTRGWRKLSATIPADAIQRAPTAARGDEGLSVRGLYVRTRSEGAGEAVQFNLDEFTAVTRDYIRKPNLNWEY